ncbi:MAG TPA: hypothetical protein VFG76_12905 [Candidatus Polarisedimenticolia bacterium]|nr:hypothetical protein [Candidatus Polarisedimenticolia bacterium]
MPPFRAPAAILSLLASATLPLAAGPVLTPDQATTILSSMHPDYGKYIAEVRYGASRLRPVGLYAGLVRKGGRDPLDPGDGPSVGRSASNDLIIFADTFEPWRSEAWRRLVIDHEYFHARHLAKGYALPVVGFGQSDADADYVEALAWGYGLAKALAGSYGELTTMELAEAASRYESHRERFRRFVMERQPSAWAHYGRFLADPGTLRATEISPRAEPRPVADAARGTETPSAPLAP